MLCRYGFIVSIRTLIQTDCSIIDRIYENGCTKWQSLQALKLKSNRVTFVINQRFEFCFIKDDVKSSFKFGVFYFTV